MQHPLVIDRLEGRLLGEDFIGDDPDRVQIRDLAGRLPEQDLRRDVAERARDLGSHAQTILPPEREAEVEHLETVSIAVLGDDDIRRLEVAMQDAAAVEQRRWRSCAGFPARW